MARSGVQTDPSPDAPVGKLTDAIGYWYRVMVGYRERRNITRAAGAEAQMNKILDYLAARTGADSCSCS